MLITSVISIHWITLLILHDDKFQVCEPGSSNHVGSQWPFRGGSGGGEREGDETF